MALKVFVVKDKGGKVKVKGGKVDDKGGQLNYKGDLEGCGFC